jgi:hypothetical protein
MVFTQADRYVNYVRELGSWQAAAQTHLPYVFGAHLHDGRIAIHAVAAVGNTRIAVGADGMPGPVPSRGFKPKGFTPLVNWLTSQVRELSKEESQRLSLEAQQAEEERLAAERSRQEELAQPQRIAVERAREQQWRVWKKVGIGVLCFVVLLFALIKGCGGGNSGSTVVDPHPTRPVPVLVEKYFQDDPCVFSSDNVISYGKVRNDGAGGNVEVVSWVCDGDRTDVCVDKKSQSLLLNAGETADWKIVLSFKNVKNPHKTYTTVSAP